MSDARGDDEALRNSDARFRLAVETLGEGVVITDADDVVVYANSRMAEISGYDREEMVGRKVALLLVPEEDQAAYGQRMSLRMQGEEGLRRARELRPSLITLDVVMSGMDGWTMLKALKADPALAAVPVVMITIVDNPALGLSLGASDYLTKPIDWTRLGRTLGRYRPAGAPTVPASKA